MITDAPDSSCCHSLLMGSSRAGTGWRFKSIMGLDSRAIIHSIMESAAAMAWNTGPTLWLFVMPTRIAYCRLVTLAGFGLRARARSGSVAVMAVQWGKEIGETNIAALSRPRGTESDFKILCNPTSLVVFHLFYFVVFYYFFIHARNYSGICYLLCNRERPR